MNRRQTNAHTMHGAVLHFFDDHPDAWERSPAITAAVEQLRTAAERVDTLAQHQHDGRTTGLTAAKAQRKEAMAEAAGRLVRALRPYARVTADPALLARVDYAPNEIEDAPDEEAVRRAQSVFDAADAHMAGLANYGATPAHAAALRAAIATFHPAGPARDAAGTLGEAATDNLPAAFDDARAALTLLDDLVPALITDPDLVAAYRNARRTDDR
jgi:hypothetical protein